MTSNWLGFVLGACLVLFQQGIKAQFIFPECGIYDTSTVRIAGGKNATPGSAPFMAYVMKNGLYHCGGSIVNHRYILTAAHCLDKGLAVRLGEHDDRTDPDCGGMVCIPPYEYFDIDVATHHRDYDNVTQNNDIALLRLDRDIDFKKHIQPICLFFYPESVPRNVRDYRAFGWGWTNGYGATTHVLQTTNLSRYYKERCENPLRNLTHNHICVGSDKSDSCRGDSGSPLVTEITTNDRMDRYVQLGIMSFGHNRCLGSGAYVYAPNYGMWIWNKIQHLEKRQRYRRRYPYFTL